MKKTIDMPIEEKRNILLDNIKKVAPVKRKKDILLMPFTNEIKLMVEKKMSIKSQIQTLGSIGIKITYKTYKNFLDLLAGGTNSAEAGNGKTIILNDKGDVKTYAVKDEIKKLGFVWDKDKRGWTKEVNEEELEKVKSLKVGYDIYDIIN